MKVTEIDSCGQLFVSVEIEPEFRLAAQSAVRMQIYAVFDTGMLVLSVARGTSLHRRGGA